MSKFLGVFISVFVIVVDFLIVIDLFMILFGSFGGVVIGFVGRGSYGYSFGVGCDVWLFFFLYYFFVGCVILVGVWVW